MKQHIYIWQAPVSADLNNMGVKSNQPVFPQFISSWSALDTLW